MNSFDDSQPSDDSHSQQARSHTGQSQLDDLVDTWQLATEAGEPVSAESLCEGCPELLEPLHQKIAIIAQFESLRPSPVRLELPDAFGPYRVIRKLGSGGWGAVYLCTHTGLQTQVAVKVMALPPGTSAARQHFEREIRTVRNFQHEGVAAIHDTGTATVNGVQFGWLAMKYLAGGQIAKYVRKQNSSESDILLFFRNIVEAMLAAHQAGILHRDIKPSNVVMSEDGKPHVTDFGLAGFLDSEPPSAQFDSVSCPGTPAYMAPELLEGTSRATVQSEIFSLGVLLFSLLTGDHPLGDDAKSRQRLMRRLRAQALPRLSTVRPEVSADLDCFVAKMLETNSSHRYQSFDSVLAEVDCLRDGRPIVARNASVAERAWRSIKREPRRAALWGGMLGLGLIAAVIIIRSELRLREYAGEISIRNEQLEASVDKLNRSANASRLRAIQSTMRTARSMALGELENVRSFPPEHRGFAWKLLNRMADDEVLDLSDLGGGFEAIHRLWFSDDDRRLIVGSKPHFLSIVDLSRRERIDVPDAMRIVGTALFPPDSQSFYGQQRDGDLLEVLLESGEVLRRLSLPITIRSRKVLTSDGRSIAGLTMDGHAFVYEISSGELQVSDETMPALTTGIWLTPDDRVLHTVNRRGDWYQWQLDDLSLLSKTPLKDVAAMDVAAMDVAAMGDGFLVKDGRVRAAEATYEAHGRFCIAVAFESGICCPVWPGNEFRIPVLARSSSVTTHFAFRPPSSCVYPDHEGGLLFSLTDPGAQHRLRPPEHSILATAVSHDGHWIATGGSHGALTLSRSPELSPGPKLLGAFTNQSDRGYGPPVCAIPLGNAGNVLICHREGWMATMNVAQSKTREAFQVAASRLSVAAFSEKHQLAVFGFQMPDSCVVAHRYRVDGTFCEPVVPADPDARTESVVTTEAQEFPIRPAPFCVFRTDFKAHVSSLCFSHDEQCLIVGLRNGELLRLDAETGIIQQHWCPPTMSSSGPVTMTSVCSVTDGVLCGRIDGRIQWRRLSDGKVVREWQAHERLIRCLVVDQRRRTIFSGAADGEIGTFAFDGRLLHRMVGHHHQVISLALSPDGETLASGSHDHNIKLWDAVTGEQQLLLNHHTGGVTGLRFADDECLYSTSEDGSVLVWDVANESITR